MDVATVRSAALRYERQSTLACYQKGAQMRCAKRVNATGDEASAYKMRFACNPHWLKKNPQGRRWAVITKAAQAILTSAVAAYNVASLLHCCFIVAGTPCRYSIEMEQMHACCTERVASWCSKSFTRMTCNVSSSRLKQQNRRRRDSTSDLVICKLCSCFPVNIMPAKLRFNRQCL